MATAQVVDAIELYHLCYKFKQLPHSGGMLEQDSYYVWLLNVVKRSYDEVERRENARMANEAKRRR